VDSLQELLAAPEVQHLSASALYLNDNVCSASIVDPDGHVLVLEEKTLPPSFSACGMVMNTEQGRGARIIFVEIMTRLGTGLVHGSL
jgi:hypothetical protein